MKKRFGSTENCSYLCIVVEKGKQLQGKFNNFKFFRLWEKVSASGEMTILESI